MGIPKVSVLIMAYNHEPYLGEALDSVLTQTTDFEVEIVVGEDDSSDGTRGVLENYAARYNNITPLYRDGTDKLYVNGKATSRKNLVDLLQNRVHGEYVAWLDGDDYWTDPLKLQKQVSTLDQNPEIAICAHRVIVLDTEGKDYIFPKKQLYPEGKYKNLDLLSENFIPSASAVFRRASDFVFPDWIYPLPYADWPLHLQNAEEGCIWLDDSVMGARRLHAGGMYTSLPLRAQRRNDHLIVKAYSENCSPKLRPAAKKRADELMELTLANDREMKSADVKLLRGLLKSKQNRSDALEAYTEITGENASRLLVFTATLKNFWEMGRGK